MELKVKTNEAPQLSEARMLLTWLREYYPNLELPDEPPTPSPEEQVDSGAAPGHQIGIPYDEATGEIIAARCGGCGQILNSLEQQCANPACPYADEEDGETSDLDRVFIEADTAD